MCHLLRALVALALVALAIGCGLYASVDAQELIPFQRQQLVSQQIGVITQFTTTFPANTPDAIIGTPYVRMCKYPLSPTTGTCTLAQDTPKFSGTLQITGANSCGFYLSPSGTVLANHTTGCSATGGPHGDGRYDDWSVVATQSGVQGSPFTQAESVTAVATIGTGPPMWAVTHQDGCFQVSGTTAGLNPPNDWSCQLRWHDSFAGDSMAIAVSWRLNVNSPGTAPPIKSVSLANNPAVCKFIPGTYANDPTTSEAVSLYLCPNMAYPASKFDVVFDGPAQLVTERTTELYGCTNPCVAEAGNSTVTPSVNGVMSISTAEPTTAPNDLVLSFAYGANSTFTAPSGTVISNASYGVSSFLTQYQVGAMPGTYTNSFTNSNAHTNVLQAVAAFKQNPAPLVAAPALVGQKVFTVLDTQVAGSAVAGGVYAYGVGDYPILSPISLSVNPGGLLNYSPGANGFTLASNPVDGTYAGQLTVTQNGVTVNQPITLIVEPPRAYPVAASNCPSTPPPAAQRAGFIHLVCLLDPANPFYHTLSNWINCTEGSNPPGFQWYPTFPSLACRDISFPTDASGHTVFEFHWHSTDDINYMRSVNSSASKVVFNSVPCTQQGCTSAFNFPIANGYWEYRGATYPLINDRVLVQAVPDNFIWGNCPKGVLCSDLLHSEWSILELDFTENYGPRAGSGGGAVHWWNNKSYGYNANDGSLQNVGQIVALVPGWSQTGMHSYGDLVTNDGASGLRVSGFVDDTLIAGTLTGAPTQIGRANPGGSINPWDLGLSPTWDPLGNDNRAITLKQYQYQTMWFGGVFGLNTPDCMSSPQCVAAGGQPDTFYDIAYVAFWTCEQYLTDPTCAGATNGLAQ